MASPRNYQDFCPVGAALNVIGERWSLLVVRDLMLGPRRYSDLLAGLGGIGTDILANRLRSLEDQGIVRRVGTGRARPYELTPSGRQLRPVLVELARWGANRLKLPDNPALVPPRVPLTALLLGAPHLPGSVNGNYEIRIANDSVTVEVIDGQVEPSNATARIRTTIILTMAGLRGLVIGKSVPKLCADRDIVIDGDRRRGERFLSFLAAPRVFEPLRHQLNGGVRVSRAGRPE